MAAHDALARHGEPEARIEKCGDADCAGALQLLVRRELQQASLGRLKTA